MKKKFGVKMYSYSRVNTFEKCKYQYKLHYIDKIETLPTDDPQDARIIGKAMHTGIEKDVESAINEYFESYNVISDKHINESIKLEYLIPKVKKILPEMEFEVELNGLNYIGFIDGLEKNPDGTFNIYDFKYSNNVDSYVASGQLHVYKAYFELLTGFKVKDLYYVFIPKTMIRQKKTEDLYQFRKRLIDTLEKMEVKIVKVDFDETKVKDFEDSIQQIESETDFEKNPNRLCNWCDYKNYCEKGQEYMLLPKNERRKVGETKKRKIWIYGASFSGKTTMLDKAPDPLNLNTDGNVEFVTMPYIPIKDEVTVNGRLTERKFAWQVFKETIDELEKKQNDFKTIIVDLLEDTREMCRVFKYDELGIQHESDSGYGKGWDIIKTEYLSTMRRFFNLDYENIVVVSHETVSEVKKKNGQTITKIAPNIQEAIATKIAGMVDLVARVVVEDDGSRTLNFKSNEYIFGGGRLKGNTETSIPLDWDELMKVYENVNSEVEEPKKERKTRKVK